MHPGAASGVSNPPPFPMALQLRSEGGKAAQLEEVSLRVLRIESELGVGPGSLGSRRGSDCWAVLPVPWVSVTD